MSKFCKLDLRRATVNTVLKETINKAIVENVQGRYSYKLIDDNYTIEIIPSEKITNNAIAKKVSNYLTRKINSYRPNVLKVVPKQIDEYSPIQLEVYVNPAFIEQKFNQLPEENRNNTPINFERDLDFFNGDEALLLQEQKKDDDYEITNDNIVIKQGVPELFESNPELANAVYEALGFKVSNSSIALNKINNTKVGEVVTLFINNMPVKYKRVSENYFEGKQITKKQETDFINSLEAVTTSIDEFIEREGTKIRYSLNEFIDFYLDKLPKTQITPQQKQQAQDKFQEYVNATDKQDIEEFKKFVNNNKIEDKTDTYFSITPEVNYNLKASEILSSKRADEIFRKGDKNGWSVDKILTELQVPQEQKQLIKNIYDNKINDILKTLEKNCE